MLDPPDGCDDTELKAVLIHNMNDEMEHAAMLIEWLRCNIAEFAIVGVRRFAELIELEADLRSAALVLARAATDTGARTDLDTVIADFGFDRAALEAELDADLATDA
ncbi:MAG: ferritin family protein [Ilumatobacteraceae bacterium]